MNNFGRDPGFRQEHFLMFLLTFPFCCYGNQISSRNKILWITLKEDYPQDHFWKVWLEPIQWFRRCCLKKLWTDGEQQCRRMETDHKISPGAFGSGEPKTMFNQQIQSTTIKTCFNPLPKWTICTLHASPIIRLICSI